ncbi:hypothetical protein DFP74_2187 [Nocardiopsis sp. Huas11]|uniref:hypothetical protein n=1 Tax=Nocardiopsis sp. Huas11 TaxID=2183912 RepID=UPI000EB33043|nr:hypothetical protein [Nocardiopsis sp. Huas11]RKS06549.1 hypothetical protein DFP74_2187 [Nocardiopsis sp. Huas11]
MTVALAAHTTNWGRFNAKAIMAVLVDLEQRGLLTSEPHPRHPDDWRFTLAVGKGDRRLTRVEKSLVGVLFAKRTTTDLAAITKAVNPRRMMKLDWHIAKEQTGLGMNKVTGRSALITLLLPTLSLALGITCAALADRIFFEGAYWVAICCALYLAGSVFVVGGPSGARSRRIRALLVQARKDTVNGGPASVAGHPAWELAVGVPNAVVDRFAAEHREAHRRVPYYYDRRYRDRWNTRVHRSLHPPRGRSGHGSSGSFGGGRTGGGGGGGGGGRR